MTSFYLIRHAAPDLAPGVLAGRSPGVHLSTEGRRQAEQLAESLANTNITQVFSSPIDRARETAEPLARKLGVPVQLCDDLIEVDFGDWTGRNISELEPLESWKQWNLRRGLATIPNGETMLRIQVRMVSTMQRLNRQFPDVAIALVSHGDPIRAAVAACLGMPLDMLHRLEIDFASVSLVAFSNWGGQVRFTNLTFPGPHAPRRA